MQSPNISRATYATAVTKIRRLRSAPSASAATKIAPNTFRRVRAARVVICSRMLREELGRGGGREPASHLTARLCSPRGRQRRARRGDDSGTLPDLNRQDAKPPEEGEKEKDFGVRVERGSPSWRRPR